MRKIQYKRLDTDCFNAHSLDSFVRHQTVTECWRKVDNKWVLVPNPFVENWTLEQCRKVAGEKNQISYAYAITCSEWEALKK